MRKVYYCYWTNGGKGSIEGPWFDGYDAPYFHHEAERVRIEYNRQYTLGLKNPSPKLKNGGTYVVEITTSPTGNWTAIKEDDSLMCHVSYRVMTKEEERIFKNSLALEYLLGPLNDTPGPVESKSNRLDDVE